MDWHSVLKPILSNRYGVLNKNETVNLIKAINRCENDLFDDDCAHAQFYTAFAALAADKLSQCTLVSQTQVPQIYDACSVLIRFILGKLTKVSVHEIKWLLPALKGLCEGKLLTQSKPLAAGVAASVSTTTTTITTTGGGCATSPCSGASAARDMHFDYNAVVSILKSTKYPDGGKSIASNSSSSSNSDKESPKSEVKRSRSDLSSIILQQLTSPLEMGKMTWTPLTEELTDCTEIFSSANIAYLQSLNGADTILDVCTSLPILTRYRLKYQETIASLSSSNISKPLYLPLTQVEATQIRNTLAHMVTDMSILWQALSLPIIQPLSPSRIEKLSKCSISALYCAVLTSIASSVLNMSSSAGTLKVQQQSSGSGASTAQSAKDLDEYEEHARFIVDKALEIYTLVGELFKKSARAYIYQNHLCYGAWLLVSGIQGALGASGSNVAASSSVAPISCASIGGNKLAATQPTTTNIDEAATAPSASASIPPLGISVKPSKSSSPSSTATAAPGSANVTAPAPASARVNLFKVQQGFGVLNVAIANHCIKLLTELIEDLRIETTCNDIGGCESGGATQLPEPANFDILDGSYTSLQRVIRVLNTATLHQLFTFLATVAYRKACALKRASTKDRTECDPISYSDSTTTYFNDTLSCSDNSEEDDSESYLGHWFKETLSPEVNEEVAAAASAMAAERNSGGEAQRSNLVPAVDEPHEYLDLAAQIFCFMDLFFASRRHAYLHRYVRAGLSDQQMLLLANILKDLDRDAARGDNETSAGGNSSGVKWQSSMIRFSGAVGRYLHNLIAASLLSESLQSSLLQHLSVSPWSTDSNAWPLQVYPSTLSVLVQILLLKPTQEKEAACLSVWHRLINTLVEGVCATSSAGADADYEDLNMEHAQLLLFLFHSLNLMQKKSILLLTAGGVIRCAEVCRGIAPERPLRNSQIMLLSRLMLFLEYLMKHLYNAPPELLDQVRWNLFSISTLDEMQKVSDLINSKTKLTTFCRKDIEEKFRKNAGDYLSSTIRPTFYSLTVIEGLTSSSTAPSGAWSMAEFKLDGLAWNFILCTPDKLKYPLLVDALIDILSVTDMTLLARGTSTHTLCAMQYCFSICWKLLLGLPPSTVHVESLVLEDRAPNLHALLWSIRCPSPSAHYLIVNSLIKQGMYTQYAETLWKNVSDRVGDICFSINQTLLGVNEFNQHVDKANPRLSQIILLDALIAQLRAIAWADKEGIKPVSNQASGTSPNNTTTASSMAAGGANSNSTTESSTSPANPAVATEQKAQHAERTWLSRDLMLLLIETFRVLSEMVRSKMTEQLSDETPAHILELVIPIVSAKNPLTADLNATFLQFLPSQDKEVVAIDWPKCLAVSESVFAGQTYPVEEYTLTVIEAHIAELTRTQRYSTLNSLKHCTQSLLALINLLLPHCSWEAEFTGVPDIADHLKPLLIAAMMDVRMEYLYELSERCMVTLLDGSAMHCAESSSSNSNTSTGGGGGGGGGSGTTLNVCAQTQLAYEHSLSHCYRLLLACAEELRHTQPSSDSHRIIFCEAMMFAVLKTVNLMLDKPKGVKALRKFLKADGGDVRLVELLLCFTGTTMSMTYARKMLQFVERLFELAEKPEYDLSLEELVPCFGVLVHVDSARIKAWLSHIIFGPLGAQAPSADSVDKVDKAEVAGTVSGVLSTNIQPSSTPSSNAQTPTNMATVSAMPSISDQLAQSSPIDCAAEAMETEDDEGIAGGALNSSGAQSNVQLRALSLWQNAATTTTTTNQSEASSQEEHAGGGVNGGDAVGLVVPVERNGALLHGVVKRMVREGDAASSIAESLFQALLQLGLSMLSPQPHETSDFVDILQIMITLSDTTQGRCHSMLFNAAIMWLEIIMFQVLERALDAKQLTTLLPPVTIDNVNALLRYLGELLQALGHRGGRALSPPWDDDMLADLEELMDEMGGGGGSAGVGVGSGAQDEDDSFLDDSDEDSLNNKLCTFSQTQKEFMNQHWYHCHTCNMINTVGVCSICARVCHRGHDVSYAKYGNFFCDCGAKDDGSCQALNRRVPVAVRDDATGSQTSFHGSVPLSATSIATVASGSGISTSSKKRAQTPPSQTSVTSSCPAAATAAASATASTSFGNRPSGGDAPATERIAFLAQLLDYNRDLLQNAEHWKNVVRCILDFFDVLMPAIRDNCAMYSIVGCHQRASDALARLHSPDQIFQLSDQLMLPTLGSQEGAFENVRMSYSGDQGQTIKQLLTSGLVRRVALCCLSSPHGRRQHLAVSHEKGKVTILQLSALLKQADAAKRKLTLTQLSAAPIPCTVLSLTANPSNEDCLAVCGLKECHILTFANSGATNDHIVLTPQLENGNFIKRALWLPGSQTLLALVTADYVKVYELAEDAYSPKYYFLVAVGKIRDCTFVCQDGVYYLLLIASSGYIYYQRLDAQSLAQHGDFYVTNTLELAHPYIKDANGQVGSGGVSIYYSHVLQLLFFSYSVGRSFMAPLSDVNAGVKSVTLLQTTPASRSASKGPPQPLCQWTEIAGHPGLICAMAHFSNNPIVFMLMPERIVVQEIKAQSSKARIMDMVAIRHTVVGVEKTTLILLCEDGSLRIFTAQPDATGFWLSPQVQPHGNQLHAATLGRAGGVVGASAASKKLKRKASGSQSQSGQKSSGAAGSGATGAAPSFPIDFFEHCTMLPDVEFGGNDLLQIYNKQKLKTRLFSTGMFVASTRPTGFTLEVYNNDPATVIVGIRVLLGTQDTLRAPQSVSVLGRVVTTLVRRARWFDIPLTRDEMLQSDKCLKVVFGRSQDPEHVSMLDSIEVYGKSKDLVCWPDECDDGVAAHPAAAATTVAGGGTTGAGAPNNGVVGGTVTLNGQATSTVSLYGSGGESHAAASVTHLDKMIGNLLELLDCSLSLLGSGQATPTIRQKSIKTATSLLLLPTPSHVQVQSRYVLATLFGNRAAYHAYKDNEVLANVHAELQAMRPKLASKETLRDVDPEAFYRLVLMVRGIATLRPQSLAKICAEQHFDLVNDLMEFVECLHRVTPGLDEPVSIVRSGLCHTETIVHCVVEILYAFALADSSQVERMTKCCIELLMNASGAISHSAKEAIIMLLSPCVKRRKVAIVSPPACSTPTPSNAAGQQTMNAANLSALAAATAAADEVLVAAASAAVGRSNSVEFGDAAHGLNPLLHEAGQQLLNLEAYMGGVGGGGADVLGGVGGGVFPQLLNADADDEAIMDIAIALSLQEHDGDGMQSLQQGLANLQGMRHGGENLRALEAAVGDSAAASTSGGGSDDEGSNVATDGSTLRTSPAEAAGSGGSESGGSGVESIGGTSGRSSTYGDPATGSPPRSASTVPGKAASAAGGGTAGGGATATSSMCGDEPPTTSAGAAAAAAAATFAASATAGGSAGASLNRNSIGAGFDNIPEAENLAKLHDLRIAILENIILNMRTFDNCGGIQAIPLIQVILMLTTDLNGNNEKDQKVLNELLTALVEYVEMDSITNASKMKDRSAKNEVRLILLCLFAVLMGKTKSKQAGTTSPPHQFKDNASFVASTTASILSNNGAFTFALVVMESMLQHWKRVSNEQNAAMAAGLIPNASGSQTSANSGATAPPTIAGAAAAAAATSGASNNLLRPVRYGPRPDISALIPHNYLKNYPDIFDAYDALLTEISVRLPYQILRLSATHPGTYDWYHNYCENMTYTLCEYMMLNLNALLRRQVRKLLMYICGNKEKFRMFRDGHSLDVHFNYIKDICSLYNTKNAVLSNKTQPVLNYDSLVELTEHLRTCQEISQIRTGNWQKFCLIHEDVMPVLIEIACYQLDDGVSPILLQLLQAALCNNVQAIKQQQQSAATQAPASSSATATATTAQASSSASSSKQQQQQQQRADRDKSEEMEMTFDSKFDSSHCATFVHQIFRYVSDALLNKFVRIFLLETNITSIRWQAHALIYAIYEHANERQKERLIDILWNMWPLVPAFGRRTAQFVDILGYLTLSTGSILDKLPAYTARAVEVLRQQNDLLLKHPNAPIYTTLEQVLQVNGYYLESEPCLVCNNPEVPLANIKLPAIKSDSKFTTTTMIVKLVQSHTISKLMVRIADLKRTKMVRTINIFYNNRTVQAVVELKNRPALWHKARSVTLQSGQTEVKIDFPLPITACNLMIEYADFYETVSGSSENLQCPRCSAAVPAYPGVCGNCGENVFQCHKCRAINYDEKDPFLCHSCGFCKYAKFDFSIYGRVCCAVDPIESAEDRAKTVQLIHSSLDRADRIYRQLQTNKQMLELLIQKVAAEHRCPDRMIDDNMSAVHSTSQVNKIIQLLAQKYCVESRTSFEELSKIVQKVKACRSELVAYDRSQQDQQASLSSSMSSSQAPDGRDAQLPPIAVNRCYGCALSSTEQCLTLLRAMASNYDCRIGLYQQGLVEELAQHNMRRGTPQIQDEVRQLLVLLTKNNKDACMHLLHLISGRVKTALLGAIPLANLDAAIHHEMVLLEVLIAQDDFGWEHKLKVVFELFLMTCRGAPRGPAISVIQPCLRIMQALICPTVPTSKQNRDLSPSELATITSMEGLTVDFGKWLAGDPQHTFDAWKARMPPNTARVNMKAAALAAAAVATAAVAANKAATAAVPDPAAIAAANAWQSQEERILAAVLQESLETAAAEQENATTAAQQQQPQQPQPPPPSHFKDARTQQRRHLTHELYLTQKYARRWRHNVLSRDGRLNVPLVLSANWLQPILFNANSRFGRQLACSLITSLSRTHERKREILNLLTGFLRYVGEAAGESSAEFLALYRALAADTPWRQYLVLKQNVLVELSQLLSAEIVKIHRLEETTLSSDLSQGYALRQFVELLSLFLESPTIRQTYKTRLLGPVLEGYLSLRKLVVQRTRLIDDAQEKLLEMLEEMTSGTEEETRAFMEILIDTVEKTRLNDIKTPVFIFERLYSIIHPEENDESEFFMTLEKDPQQEDFLQGRMLGNPYPSTEQGLGPLMRDVKNKICTDCELIALLEDDNGMELLVNNKIISLDLPVKDVYKRVWLAEGGERDAMRIVYRMRGLLGDATEEFVETLNSKSQEEVDTEQLYRMANVLAECNGLKVMLDRIGSLQSISRTRELVQVLLKLFLICVKVRRCQEVLCQPELGAVNTLLRVLQMCLQSENDNSIQSSVTTEQLLEIMETILSKAASDTLDSFLQFSLTFGGPEYVSALISCTDCANVRNNPSVLRHLIRVLAALVYGNEVKMALLCEHFKDILDFNRFDADRLPEEEFKLELFCVLTNQIEHNCIGGTLKDYIVSLGIVERAIDYITQYAPCVKPTLLRTDSDELKEFISRPSLKYILRFLTGLATKHSATQLAISKDIIPIIHRLEQVSSDEHVGSLAENLLEALCTDAATAQRVQEVRDFTRTEKKRLAMATREKQLDALGMRTNEKGQVTAKGSILQKIEKLRDETGLTCFICREGYACQPAKVLGIYTFTKRCNVEEYELKSRKTVGYTTVTHFNVVHVDCHTSAIRLARGRDEWERASLQNANTRCNGLLPLWGPDVSEAAFSACMVRHSSYMQESTQRCDISFPSSVHDLKLLLMRFAWERSFHDDAGGGGPQSNMHFVPYLLFFALYVLLSSRSASRDSKTLLAYLTAAAGSDKWLDCGYDVEGPLYMLTLSLTLHSHEMWNKHKLSHLRRLLAVAQARHVSPAVQCKALLAPSDRQTKEFAVYRPFLMMWALVDMIYNTLFRSVNAPKEEDWSMSLFDYIRKNDEALLKSTDAVLHTFTEEYLPCASFAEFCDVAGLLNLIENPESFIDELLASLPTTTTA